MKTYLCGLVLVLGLAMQALGAEDLPPALAPGNPAPPIKVGKWIKGAPVEAFTPGRYYVVEFWATWCGPCRTTVPHLTELARRYKDRLTVIGVSIAENEDKDQARYKAVADFVKSMGSKMEYRVAADTTDGYMSKAWMDAAKQDGIPVAFLIGPDGKILWIGSPLGGLDKELSSHLSAK